MEQENTDLKLYLASVLRLLASKQILSAEELSALVEGIDGKSEG